MSAKLWTYAQAAKELGTTYRTISGVVAVLKLTPKPFPHNGRAKALDAADMKVLRRALTPPKSLRLAVI